MTFFLDFNVSWTSFDTFKYCNNEIFVVCFPTVFRAAEFKCEIKIFDLRKFHIHDIKFYKFFTQM